MAAGTHTKFLVGLMLLVNALVLVNIRRYSPELPRAAGSSFRETRKPKTSEAVRRRQRTAAATATFREGLRSINATRQHSINTAAADVPAAAATATATVAAAAGERAAAPSQYNADGSREGSRADGARRPDGEEAMRTSLSSAARLGGGEGGERLKSDNSPALRAGAIAEGGSASGAAGGDGNGGQTGPGVEAGLGGSGAEGRDEEGGEREAGAQEPNILQVQADRRRKQTEECRNMMNTLRIVPNRSWGRASRPEQQRWDLLGCNGLVEMAGKAGGGGHGGGLRLPDCTARPSSANDPLIAVCAGSTTRGVPFPDEQSLALFRFLLPSLARTADCGFRYLAVVGYDVGDGFFDSAAGKAKTMAWFESEVSRPAALRGLSIELELVRVENRIKKPGPVFTAITKAAYDRGANYIYRVNDDSEMHTPWAESFVNALEAMGPPYGVVGPESLNKNILVHDFTHRLHMDIFDKQYYPASLTDWFVDDWISRVYGNARTIRARNCKVEHHTGAHGQRYKEDATKAGSVSGLVAVGSRKIAAWAKAHGAEEAAARILADKFDGMSAKQAHARNIP